MATGPVPQPPAEGVELIKAFEGIPDGDPSTANIDAYLCPANVWTIGWGHAIVHNGLQLKGAANKALARQLYPGGITMAQATDLLRADLIGFCAGVQRLLKVPVDDAQFGALLAFAFNVGNGALAQSTLLRKLNARDFADAAEQFLVWDKARVNGVLTALAGLTRRRRTERAMFLGQDWRAVAAQRTRSAKAAPALACLPVPEMPEADRLEAAALEAAANPAVPRAPAARTRAAKKTVVGKASPKAPAEKASAKTSANGTATKPAPNGAATKRAMTKEPSSAKKSPTPRARTTTATVPTPAPSATRRGRRKAP